MTITQHSQLQNIFKYFETLQPEQIEQAFLSHWKPFVLSLSTEDDRALAFKLFYEWQTAQADIFLNFLQAEQSQPASA
ncbi:MAG: hypothetical protein H7246_05050 [Phycisphaerae bacterium]|nr:hypothetical protein [Saprospiraceae bacterium]